MHASTTELERAFQLAKSGECHSVDEIRKKLSQEGYYATHVTGKGLTRQLQAIIAVALQARNSGRKCGGAAAAPAEVTAIPAKSDRGKSDRKRPARNGIHDRRIEWVQRRVMRKTLSEDAL